MLLESLSLKIGGTIENIAAVALILFCVILFGIGLPWAIIKIIFFM